VEARQRTVDASQNGINDRSPAVTMTSAARMQLEDLIRCAGLGDLQSFQELYDLTATRVLGLARAIVIDRSAAQDVTHDAYLEIWRRAPQYDAAASPAMPWIVTITHARAVDHVLRSEQARRKATAKARAAQDVAASDQVIHAVSAQGEHDARLQAALLTLTWQQREAIQLLYWGGLTGPEASQVLNIPFPTFKARLRDAMVSLRTADLRKFLQ
jgi:RNA polymerase sigma-70 factor (ECF subfamily)